MLTPEQGAAMHAQIAMALEDLKHNARAVATTRLHRLQELVDDVVPDVDESTSKTFTVIGYWSEEGYRHVIGVVEGEHDVTGGVEPNDYGLFAEQVEAEDAEAAENKVHGTTEDDDEEPDFTFEELDARFTKLPNPSDPSEADHWEYEDAVKMPLNQVWTVVEGDSGSSWWAEPGFHIVNKLFYVVTEEPWAAEDSGKNFRY